MPHFLRLNEFHRNAMINVDHVIEFAQGGDGTCGYLRVAGITELFNLDPDEELTVRVALEKLVINWK